MSLESTGRDEIFTAPGEKLLGVDGGIRWRL
jgi:hypothetical protein